MQFELTSFIMGVLVGVVVAVAFSIPRAGRIIAGIAAVTMVTAGAGFLVWAITATISNETLRPISWQQLHIASQAEAYGMGGGLLIGGILSLVLSLRGVRRKQASGAASNAPLSF